MSNFLDIGPGDIHLWYTWPSRIREEPLLSSYRQLLNPEETRKQQRYQFETHRHDALVTRSFLRDLLSCYVPVAPADWRFSIGERGRPEVIEPPIPIRFNLSHTRGLITCAVTLADDIGCDVEYVSRRSDPLLIASQYFAEAEIEELYSLPKDERRSRFFDYWTLKESYIKACGSGIFAVPLQHFCFLIGERPAGRLNGNIRITFEPNNPQEPAAWRSWLYYPSADYRIALSLHSAKPAGAGERHYNFRLFESVPLVYKQELEWGSAIE